MLGWELTSFVGRGVIVGILDGICDVTSDGRTDDDGPGEGISVGSLDEMYEGLGVCFGDSSPMSNINRPCSIPLIITTPEGKKG